MIVVGNDFIFELRWIAKYDTFQGYCVLRRKTGYALRNTQYDEVFADKVRKS